MEMNKKKRCDEIIAFIIKSNHNVLKDMTPVKLAAMYNVNRSYLSKTFKQCTGIGLSNYLVRIKLLKCTFLLKENDLTVKQIAEKYGWDRTDTFRALFKKFFGMTPGNFRIHIRWHSRCI